MNYKIFKKILITIFILISFLFCSNLVLALSTIGDIEAGTGNIGTEDAGGLWEAIKGRVEQAKEFVRKQAVEEIKALKDEVAAKAFKTALKNFLNKMAYETAVYLATGDEGQKPMFYTEGWGAYLKDAGDTAAGDILEVIGREGPIKFNLCSPSAGVMTKINLGLWQEQQTSQPACTFTEMRDSWAEATQKATFLNDFQDMFNPWSNDLGIAFTLHGSLDAEIKSKINAETQARVEGAGWKPVRSIIDNKIKTPADIVGSQSRNVLDKSTAVEQQFTGQIAADAIDIFINTLSGKLINKWLTKGIVEDVSNVAGTSDLSNPYSIDLNSSLAKVRERYRDLIEPSFKIRGDYNILMELSQCGDPTKAGPTNCVIEDNFRQAIQQRLTVGKAMSDGYLNASGIFGFTSNGLEPAYNQGYPYRSMIILRKFRILPVGWEVAAQFIKDNTETSGRTKNLGDLISCYSSSDQYQGYFADWCEGLVDPSWVLKAPLNYCQREGPGPQILSSQIVGQDQNSSLAISRDTGYCADEQSCIKESNSGACEVYGYCTEERRKWNFNENSCDPKYNTCQTFRSVSGAKTVSFLENTLEYCSSENSGCLAYCDNDFYNVDNDQWSCSSTSINDKVYFNSKTETCDKNEQGCHEFIRLKNTGANLLTNASFEEDLENSNLKNTWSNFGTTTITQARTGTKSLELTNNLNTSFIIDASEYILAGKSFALSFYSYGCTGGTFGLGSATSSLSSLSNTEWKKNSLVYIYLDSYATNTINIFINPPAFTGCSIDDIKLEQNSIATTFSNYREQGLIYQKLAPSYMHCNQNPAPEDCSYFVSECSASQLGCELYTSYSNGMQTPAKISYWDYCPADCVGYGEYFQTETSFDNQQPDYFIPTTADTCQADSVGCDAFTNLDNVESGGESEEFFSHLRQCSLPGADCARFYTWEGNSEQGQQLREYNLKADSAGAPIDISGGSMYNNLNCSETDYDLINNPMCRKFFNVSGQTYYRFYNYTVTCSDNCQSFRRTEKNIDFAIYNQADCGGQDCQTASSTDKCWDSVADNCVYCKNGGTWNNNHQACIYMAIPEEGTVCSEVNAGCREYKGNFSNNIRKIFTNHFESGDTDNWTSLSASTTLSNEALSINGHSLLITTGDYSTYKNIDNLISIDTNYMIRFLAKSNGATQITQIYFENSANKKINFATTTITSEWNLYELNMPLPVNHVVDSNEKLVIQGNGSFYLDDIILTEVNNRYYLKKNSWITPDTCYNDINGDYQGSYHNMGCDRYRDRSNNVYNLRQFSALCPEQAAGCELMLDTNNYTNPKKEAWNDENDDNSCVGDGVDCVEIPKDTFKYIVYDAQKSCYKNDKGCEYFGKSYTYGEDVIYTGLYLENDPDKYDQIICQDSNAGCTSWQQDNDLVYFKSPGDMVCEWRQKSGQGALGWGWYKKKIKRCDDNKDKIINIGTETKVCLNNNNCEENIRCITDSNDYDCPTSNLKTLGFGGIGNEIAQPSTNWAGLCDSNNSGCSEYIDPISSFNNNLIANADFSRNINTADAYADEWVGKTQTIGIEANTLYILGIYGSNTVTIQTSDQVLYVLRNDNIFDTQTNTLTASNTSKIKESLQFYTGANTNITLTVDDASPSNGSTIEFKKAIIEYQLKQDIDNTSCNGQVNFNSGCVLFNERIYNGTNLAQLTWDADLTVGRNVPPQTGDQNSRDSNVLLQVSPDRECNEWLSCRSFIKDTNNKNVCFDISLCSSFDSNGNCNKFVESKKENQLYHHDNKIDISNLTGYVKIGHSSSTSFTKPNDLYNFGAMKQDGEVVHLANGNFEIFGENLYPIGWIYENGNWDKNFFQVINNPIESQSEGICFRQDNNKNCILYNPEGYSYLKLGSTFDATSESVDVVENSDYVLTAFINTINLSSGSAIATIINDTGAEIASVSLSVGSSWEFRLIKFNTGGSKQIKVKLHADSDIVSGNFYFDDIKLMPALNSRKNWYTPRSCRIYPQDDSLSCDYYDDAGQRQKGWPGYCLEYDRYPGSSDACLLWYPVDKIKGEGLEEGAGYRGKFPVYYCLESKKDETVKIPGTKATTQIKDLCISDATWGCNGFCYKNSRYPVGPGGDYPISSYTDPDLIAYGRVYLELTSSNVYGRDDDIAGGDGCHGYLESVDAYTSMYCTRFVQVISSIGQNKSWSGRVYEGSSYSVGCNIEDETSIDIDISGIAGACTYTTDDAPFGSITSPASVHNPYDWDTRDGEGIQPLYHNGKTSNDYTMATVNGPKMGQLYKISEIKKLFVQSYKTWAWLDKACATGTRQGMICKSDEDCPVEDTDGIIYTSCDTNPDPHYTVAPSGICSSNRHYCLKDAHCPIGTCQSTGWNVPSEVCPGSRDDNYCAIVPVIENIKVDGNSTDVIINTNGFVNLTFNSLVDNEQEPLVMYAINWVDNEVTLVSGVEAHDKPSEQDPHSFYHLYSYWDLLSKKNIDQRPIGNSNYIFCGDASGLARNYENVSNSKTCPATGNCCMIKPGVKIKDNWGWCNSGEEVNSCDTWKIFSNWVIVTE